jgi:hypothetical protein
VSAEQVALIPQCAECGERWLPDDVERWSAYFDTGDELEPISCSREADDVVALEVRQRRAAEDSSRTGKKDSSRWNS